MRRAFYKTAAKEKGCETINQVLISRESLQKESEQRGLSWESSKSWRMWTPFAHRKIKANQCRTYMTTIHTQDFYIPGKWDLFLCGKFKYFTQQNSDGTQAYSTVMECGHMIFWQSDSKSAANHNRSQPASLKAKESKTSDWMGCYERQWDHFIYQKEQFLLSSPFPNVDFHLSLPLQKYALQKQWHAYTQCNGKMFIITKSDSA